MDWTNSRQLSLGSCYNPLAASLASSMSTPASGSWAISLSLAAAAFGCCPNFRCSAGFQPALSRQDGGATFKLVGHVTLRHPQSMKMGT